MMIFRKFQHRRDSLSCNSTNTCSHLQAQAFLIDIKPFFLFLDIITIQVNPLLPPQPPLLKPFDNSTEQQHDHNKNKNDNHAEQANSFSGSF